jgi:hypothetical protein
MNNPELREEWEYLGALLVELENVADMFFDGDLGMLRSEKGWKIWVGSPSRKNPKLATEERSDSYLQSAEPDNSPPRPLREEIQARLADVVGRGGYKPGFFSWDLIGGQDSPKSS